MENSKNNKEKNNESKKFWISSIVLLIIISVLSAIAYLVYNNNNEEKDKLILPYTELIQKINDNTVEKIEMTVGSTTVKVKLKDEEEEKTTIVPSLQAFSEYIQTKTEQGNEMEVLQKEPNVLLKIGDWVIKEKYMIAKKKTQISDLKMLQDLMKKKKKWSKLLIS